VSRPAPPEAVGRQLCHLGGTTADVVVGTAYQAVSVETAPRGGRGQAESTADRRGGCSNAGEMHEQTVRY